MRWIFVLAASLAVTPASAQDVAIDSAVYIERIEDGANRIEPADRVTRGDRVITILRWQAPETGRYTATSAIPQELRIESASYPGLEVSTDGGRTWHKLVSSAQIPSNITHLRWPVGGDGRLSYRAVVR